MVRCEGGRRRRIACGTGGRACAGAACSVRGEAARVRAVCARGVVDGACAGCTGVVVGAARHDGASAMQGGVRPPCGRACVRRATSELRRASGECMAVSLGGSEIRWRRLPYAELFRRREH